MNCQQAQTLFGVRAELDGPTRRAIDAHLAQCPACAAASQAEREFERLMAQRSLPSFSHELKRALLTTPPPGLFRLQLRLWLGKLVPALAVAALVISGTFLASIAISGEWRPLFGPVDGGSSITVADASATRVLRERPDRAVVLNRVTTTPQPRRVAAADMADSLAAERTAAAPTAPLPAASPGPGRDAAAAGPLPPTPTRPPTDSLAGDNETGDENDDGEDSDGENDDDGTETDATPDGGQPGSGQTPTTEPVATPFVELHISAVADVAGGSDTCPGCDLNIVQADREAARELSMADIRVEIVRLSDTGSDDTRTTVELVPVEPGSARASVRIDPGARWRIRLLQAPGFVACPAAGTERILDVSPDDGPAAVSFFLGLECPSALLEVVPEL